jgi:hypothetical protein
MAFADNTRFHRSSTVVSRQIGNELVVVPIRGGVGDLDAVFSFNSVGADVWTLLENEQTFEELVGWVVDHYEAAEREQVEKDINDFVSDLLNAGLATMAGGPFPSLDMGLESYASR